MWPLSYWNLKCSLQYALYVLVFVSWLSQYPLYHLFLQLINVHRKQRLEFAKKHLKWFKRWRNVIFLDEKMVNFKKVEVLLSLFTDDREICKTPTNRRWKYNHNSIIKRRKLYSLRKFYYIYLITCIKKCLDSQVLILDTVQTFNIIVIIVYIFYIQSIFRH